MKTYRITLKVQSAFGTPLVGDSLFGQFCWAIANHFGQDRLTSLLQGYTEQKPFAVFSDAFPSGYLPLPCLPSKFWQKTENVDRKVLKKKQWIPLETLQQPLSQWQQLAKAEKDVMEKTLRDQPHNSINRSTHSTGTGMFAPYMSEQIWYKPDTMLDIYLVLDEKRLTLAECEVLLDHIGKLGFGRDASIGLGKFERIQTNVFNHTNQGNAYLTLANTAPQQLDLDKTHCYYQITTRFGRHGDVKALMSNPFKKPIILAKTSSVFTPKKRPDIAPHFLGNGLGNVSYAQPEAVHQGYAPIIPIQIEFSE